MTPCKTGSTDPVVTGPPPSPRHDPIFSSPPTQSHCDASNVDQRPQRFVPGLKRIEPCASRKIVSFVASPATVEPQPAVFISVPSKGSFIFVCHGIQLALLEATGVESSRRAKSCVNGDDKYPSCKCIFFTFKRSSCFTADKSAIPVAISILDELFPPSTQ